MDKDTIEIVYEYYYSMGRDKILNDIYYIHMMRPFFTCLKNNIFTLNLLRNKSARFSPGRPVPRKHKNYGQNKYLTL